MQILFVLVAIGGALYFGFAKRRFDAFCVAYGSALIYFSPGFVGTVPYASKGYWIDPMLPIVPSAYGVMTLVLAAIWVTAHLYKRGGNVTAKLHSDSTMPYVSTAFTVLALLGFAGTLATTGLQTLQMTEKELIMEQLNRSYTLWSGAASIGVVVAFASRKYVEMTICALLVGGCMYVGFRLEFVISALAIFFVYAAADKPQRLVIRFRKWLFPLTIVMFFVLIFKVIYIGVKFDDYWFIFERLSDPDTYENVLFYSEPFYIQGTLNEVLASDFSVGLDHLADIFFLAIPRSSELGITAISFNDLFQPALFPQAVAFGLANNIWAQMWSAGGWLLLFLFVLVFCAAIAAGESIRRKVGLEAHAIVVVALMYWCFYIHRNDLIFQLLIERNILIISFVAYLLSRVINILIRGKSERLNQREFF